MRPDLADGDRLLSPRDLYRAMVSLQRLMEASYLARTMCFTAATKQQHALIAPICH